MTQYTKRAIIIVRADLAAAANVKAAELPDGGAPFTVGLSQTGQPPAQAYVLNWQFLPAQAQWLREKLEALPNAATKVRVFPLDSWDPAVARPTLDECLAQLELKRIRLEAA